MEGWTFQSGHSRTETFSELA